MDNALEYERMNSFRNKTLVTLSYVMFFFVAALGVVTLIKGASGARVIAQFTVALLILACIYISKKKGDPKILGIATFSLALTHLPIKLYLHGTILSSTPVWFVAVPPLAVYFVSNRFGLYLAYVAALEVITLFFVMRLNDSNWDMSKVRFSALEYETLISIVVSLFISVIFMIRMEKERSKWEKLVKDQLLLEGHSSVLATMGEMAAGLAHEINNPLTVILGNAQVMTRELNREDTDKDKLLYKTDKIKSTAERIKVLTRSLLNLSRKDTSFELEVVEIRAVFDLFHPLVNERLKSMSTTFSYDESKLDISLKCNAQIVAQAILNLINNSIHALEESEEKWISFEVEENQDTIVLSVVNGGEKIGPSIEKKMFDPFFTTKEIGKGTGLGLSLSRTIIAKVGGFLYYDSSAKNTTFRIKLPKYSY